MLYVITGTDHPDSLEKRNANRATHIARLKQLQDEGRLLLAGPFPAIDSVDPGAAGYSGSLIIAEFPSLAEAEAWANADSYVTGGVFSAITVRPFRKTLPA
ncbi:MAG: YciI family protein [Methylobacillus sp.]|jgi:uncharacterized protein YciI|nr:YciI family protein [Methylobacillus sp.]